MEFVRLEVITFYFDNFLKGTKLFWIDNQHYPYGLSLKVDGSEDAEKPKFQGQEIGIPPGLEIWSVWLKIFYQKRWLVLHQKTLLIFFFFK